MSDKSKKSYAPIYLFCAAVLVVAGLWFNHWLNSVNYSEEKFRLITTEQFDLADLRGYVTYLDFWASWCAPCLQSFPWMQSMRERYADSGLRIVAVNLDQSEEEMNRFVQQFESDFTIVTDSSYSLFRQFAVKGVPTSVLFDTQGNEVWRHEGFQKQHQDDYEQQIINALGKS